MATFRYGNEGVWLKGNTHIHSTASDGGKKVEELARMYSSEGYDFLFITDHWKPYMGNGKTDFPLLVLDGVELDGKDAEGAFFHIVCLGTLKGMRSEMGLEAGLKAAREQGAVIILAHPHWTGNTPEEGLRLGVHGVEVYNHVCAWLNGKENGGWHWDRMLETDPSVVGLAVDDAHIRPEHPGWNGGWIHVQTAAKSQAAILEAIRKGRFYSSLGPRFHSLSLEGNTVHLRCSPVRFVRLVGWRWKGMRIAASGGADIIEASFEIPADYPYARLEIEDAHGARAWTNTLLAP